ncbi:MAG: hypothetical protein CMH22_06380 [Methylophaga sp.]|nr:hypothetical protein [Methylophaga sp.]MAX51590.1 hypothetical protein [Methylophaga sp.]|tara:strand:- start:14765 stop:14971 length:207 start_codon:yes stop_codon:yes gene_type:complete
MGVQTIIENLVFERAYERLDKSYQKWQIKRRFDLGDYPNSNSVRKDLLLTKICKFNNCNLKEQIENYE